MSRILFAWELGANFGHLSKDVLVALQLRKAGHEVVFAVRDTYVAAQVLSPHKFDFVQAPGNFGRNWLSSPPANYAELLATEGWCDDAALHGHLSAWIKLIEFGRFAGVVADHAPGALLAARVARCQAITLGNGFEIPPDLEPMPSIRPWEKHSPENLLATEQRMVSTINQVLARFGSPGYERLGQMFPPDAIFTTFPELDHYGPRPGANYVGSIHGIDGLPVIPWPATSGPRVVVYLRKQHKVTALVLSALATREICTVCVIPDAGQELKAKYQNTSVQIVDRPVALAPLLQSATALVGYASIGAMVDAMLHGVPVLAIPTTVEQYLVAMRAKATGAAYVLDRAHRPEQVGEGLDQLLENPVYRTQAERFARRYQKATVRHAVERAAQKIGELMAIGTEQENDATNGGSGRGG